MLASKGEAEMHAIARWLCLSVLFLAKGEERWYNNHMRKARGIFVCVCVCVD